MITYILVWKGEDFEDWTFYRLSDADLHVIIVT